MGAFAALGEGIFDAFLAHRTSKVKRATEIILSTSRPCVRFSSP